MRDTMEKRTLVERANTYAKAITEPNRMKILKIIGSAPPETVSVSDIAKMLNLSQPAVSKHLQILNWCGFAIRKKVGNTVYYSIDPETVEDFKRVAASAFEMVRTPCLYGYDCESCPYGETCH